MQRQPTGRAERGFTLIETLVVLVIMLVLMTFAIPSLLVTMRQGRLRGAADQAATLMRLARLEAIKRSCPAIVRVVAAAAPAPERVEAIVDCTGDGLQDADKKALGTAALPARIHLLAPPNLAGKDSVWLFSPDPAGGDANVAIFQGDGSISDTGAFRFGDDAGNFLEVRVAPEATARIEVRKCLVCTTADWAALDWYANGEAGRAWTWK
jgi:prepilin-type N-terminal cleavage/methylation domain-containing protein